ncbi:conserved hypothetical protein [Gammaproteobacteria bacterium]
MYLIETKRLAVGLWVGLSVVAGQNASAHTVIQNPATEATTTYNNLVIGHGCTLADGSKQGVIAQSVVFPTVNPIVTVSSGTFAGNPVPFSQTTLANIPQLIQNKDIFTKQAEKRDAKGNVIGFTNTEGYLDPDLHGLVPFRTAGINFTPDGCAKTLLVKVAIADVCQKNGANNLWIPAVTPKFPDPAVDGIGAPATLIFNRDLVKNPFAAASNCGTGYEITLTPSTEDIDANLPIPGYLP